MSCLSIQMRVQKDFAENRHFQVSANSWYLKRRFSAICYSENEILDPSIRTIESIVESDPISYLPIAINLTLSWNITAKGLWWDIDETNDS